MNCDELEQKIADYAMGTLPPAEAATFERGLAACPDLAAEYADLWQPVVAALPFALTAPELDPAMRARVLSFATTSQPAALSTAQQPGHLARNGSADRSSSYQPPVRLLPTAPTPAGQRLTALLASPRLAWAAVVLLLLVNLASVGWGANVASQLNERIVASQQASGRAAATAAAQMSEIDHQKGEIAALLSERDVQMVSLKPMKEPNTVVRAYYVPNKHSLYVVLSNFQPPAQKGGSCQLWARMDNTYVNLGPVELSADGGSIMTHADRQIANYSGLVITWEVGKSSQPSNMMIAEGDMTVH